MRVATLHPWTTHRAITLVRSRPRFDSLSRIWLSSKAHPLSKNNVHSEQILPGSESPDSFPFRSFVTKPRRLPPFSLAENTVFGMMATPLLIAGMF
jgi:hypothetical protein